MRRILLALTAASFLSGSALAAPSDASASWVWPVTGNVITPYRNGTDPYATGQHRGIDIAAPVGTTVRAATAGDVRFAGTAGSSGLTVGIRTGDGYDTSYLHLSSLAVRAGAHVAAGDRIGAVGTTGTPSTGAPHLHFGVRDAGTRFAYHDPLAFLPPQPVPTGPGPSPPGSAPVPAPRPAPAPGHPAPASEPLAPVAAPMPVRAPRTAPAPRAAPNLRPGGAPRRYPTPGAAPQALTAPRPLPHRSPARVPSRSPAGRPSGALEAAHRHDRTPSSVGLGRPVQGPARASQALGVSADGASSPSLATGRSPARTGDGPRPGPDLGWALACAGLLLAAGILGIGGKHTRRSQRAGARVRGVLRPLVEKR